jgi:hypothetical protein
MKTIEISDETIDALIKDVLIKDYIGFVNRVKELEAIENPETWQQADLEDEKYFLKAMKVMLTYYLDFDSYTELFNETSNS